MMAYWHRLHVDGWICPDCGTRQYGEYECESDYCEAMRQADAERDRKRARRDMLAAVIASEPFLSPAERRALLSGVGQ
jgi:hypothetical protein